ncbi:hypothetical protein chiPu_0008566 [Chiloscyllium punctatum]|uniref:Uncharacterized protein n=1 Tax=Chiloscyllium punctatum TaxID=137246 RepID=A0A401SI82_CHIPU|nr:hypothetical protein [Chiloscyllium punctatum]
MPGPAELHGGLQCDSENEQGGNFPVSVVLKGGVSLRVCVFSLTDLLGYLRKPWDSFSLQFDSKSGEEDVAFCFETAVRLDRTRSWVCAVALGSSAGSLNGAKLPLLPPPPTATPNTAQSVRERPTRASAVPPSHPGVARSYTSEQLFLSVAVCPWLLVWRITDTCMPCQFNWAPYECTNSQQFEQRSTLTDGLRYITRRLATHYR